MQSKQEQIFSSRTITYFLQLSDTMNYTQAAQILGITQPALSQQIKKLEKAVGAPLFYSVGKRLRLTDAGYTMLTASHQINKVLNKATDEIQQSSSAKTGEIFIGVLSSIETRVFEDFIVKYFDKEPDIKISFILLNRKEIWEHLENNTIDLAIMYLPDENIKNWKPYEVKNIMHDSLLLLHHNPIMHDLDEITPSQAAQLNWVTYPKGFYLREALENEFTKQLVDFPKIKSTMTTPDQIGRFAENSELVTALPKSYLDSHQHMDGIYTNSFKPAINFDLDFVFRKDKINIPRIKNFLAEFDQYLDEKGYTNRLEDMKK